MIKYSRIQQGLALASLTALEKSSAVCSNQVQRMISAEGLDPRFRTWLDAAPLDHATYTYTVVVPLGADESWEETINGDAFERCWLEPEHSEFGHKTFEIAGRAYRHHRNKDPQRSYGDLPFMCYNTAADRCEGIWRLENSRAAELGAQHVIDKIRAGQDVPISMGCKVPHDICSFCGNKAKSPLEYCVHPRVPGFGHIDPETGRKMRVFNPNPFFFDLSDVDVNAAPEALTLGWLSSEVESALRELVKGSSACWVVPSAARAQALSAETMVGGEKRSSALAVKASDLLKIVPAMTTQLVDPMLASEPRISDDELDKIACACGNSAGATLSTLGGLGIVLHPQEFQRVLRVDGIDGPLHTSDVHKGLCNTRARVLTPDAVRRPGVEAAQRLCPERSILFPFLAARLARQLHQGGPPRSTSPAIPQVRVEIQLTGVPSVGEMYGVYLRDLALRAGHRLARQVAGLLRNPGDLQACKASGSMSSTRLAAQALLPSALILGHAPGGWDATMLWASTRALNAGAPELFGGMVGGWHE